MTNKGLIFSALLTVAAANKCGYTVNKTNLRKVCTGYAVSVHETQNCFNRAGLRRVINYVSKHPEINAFGGWYDKVTRRFYFDATIICDDVQTAKDLARIEKQIAFFCLDTCKEIRL